jgi:hypothetical protein
MFTIYFIFIILIIITFYNFFFKNILLINSKTSYILIFKYIILILKVRLLILNTLFIITIILYILLYISYNVLYKPINNFFIFSYALFKFIIFLTINNIVLLERKQYVTCITSF